MKSRHHRRVFVKTPKGVKVVIKRRKPKKAKCAGCGKILSGVISDLPYRINKFPKTAKRPCRPFGGVLCASCSRRKIIEEVDSKILQKVA